MPNEDEQIRRNDIEQFERDMLVVDLGDLALVQRYLTDRLNIRSLSTQDGLNISSLSTEAGTSKELGLALLNLPDLDAQIGLIKQDTKLVEEAKQERLYWLQTFKKDITIDKVELASEDLVVFALRRCFRGAYRGWAPTFDKLHVLDLIAGCPYHKGGIGPAAQVPQPLHIPSGTGPPGPRVGIADTAIFPHPDLVGRYVGDTLRPPPEHEQPPPTHPFSSEGHATFVAGLILQRAPDAELIVRQVLNSDGINASSWDVAVKLMGFLDAEVSVLNMSFGCVTADSRPPLVLQRAVERLSRGMVLVAAAGNNGGIQGKTPAGITAATPSWPAAFDEVVAVGALIEGHELADFTPNVPLVDLLAPGVGVQSTFLSGPVLVHTMVEATSELSDPKIPKDPHDFGTPGYASWNGTSFAAAAVSGEIAKRMRSGHMTAYEALDDITDNPGDVIPFPLPEARCEEATDAR